MHSCSSLSIGIEFQRTNVPWDLKMLIGGLCHQLISSSVVGVGSLIDGSQNAVSPLAFRRIMKNNENRSKTCVFEKNVRVRLHK